MNTNSYYKIFFEKPFTHYCDVEIRVPLLEPIQNKEAVIFSMPVWTPGSYLVREFARNVEQVKAYGSRGDQLIVAKVNKNSWKVNARNQEELVIKYKVYCNEISVRTCEINTDHAFLVGAGIFMYVKGLEDSKCLLEINLPEGWKKISTGLSKVSAHCYSAENYDELIDCPLEIGNHKVIEFSVWDITHYICIFGEGNYVEEVIIRDIKKIVEEQIKFFGEIPYKEYTFLIRLLDKGMSGLEHANSFAIHFDRWGFNDKKLYKKFLSLVSHEFFHLWNCKRIKPAEFCPYDYENEIYTKSLWVVEGWTSYFDILFVKRSGLFSKEDYFSSLDKRVNDVLKYQGRSFQTLEDSSFDTWIKFYRKDENFNNAQISYYTKGALVALMLNLEIIKSTNANYSFDDVIKELYENYKRDVRKGFTAEQVKEIFERISGKNLDEFWNKYVCGTDELPLEEYLESAGLKMENTNADNHVSLDIETVVENGKLILTKVFAGGSAYESGLNANDEILSLNGQKVNGETLENRLKDFSVGDSIEITIFRDGSLKNVNVNLLPHLPNYKIIETKEKNNSQMMILNKWLEG